MKEKNKKLIRISIITYLFGIIPSFIILYPDARTDPELIPMGLLGPAAAFSVLMIPSMAIYFSTIHRTFKNPQSQESHNAQWVMIVITLIVSVISLWIYALINGDLLHINEEYFYENQINETSSGEQLENLKDGEFTEENFEPVE